MRKTGAWVVVVALLLPAAAIREVAAQTSPIAADLDSSRLLLELRDSTIKFSLLRLMSVLRDNEHEGWVLAAYPDPKTGRPLIGAGFSLDVRASDHPQTDPLNPNGFVEPSSLQLWQAAGLAPERLDGILDKFAHNQQVWSERKYRRKIRTQALSPDLTEEEATRLLRISALQAIHNARAYCRDFDQLTGSQQMALSQLVFQMGVNLEEFVIFLSALNRDTVYRDLSQPDGGAETEAEHWKSVQRALVDSQWATHFTTRATTVIAMFDPEFTGDPNGAQLRVEAALPPPVIHHRKKSSANALRVANRHGKTPGSKARSVQLKRKVA